MASSRPSRIPLTGAIGSSHSPEPAAERSSESGRSWARAHARFEASFGAKNLPRCVGPRFHRIGWIFGGASKTNGELVSPVKFSGSGPRPKRAMAAPPSNRLSLRPVRAVNQQTRRSARCFFWDTATSLTLSVEIVGSDVIGQRSARQTLGRLE